MRVACFGGTSKGALAQNIEHQNHNIFSNEFKSLAYEFD
jgi:hypothetical protein